MSDGREEREEQEKRREEEARKDRLAHFDLLNPYETDLWEPERPDS